VVLNHLGSFLCVSLAFYSVSCLASCLTLAGGLAFFLVIVCRSCSWMQHQNSIKRPYCQAREVSWSLLLLIWTSLKSSSSRGSSLDLAVIAWRRANPRRIFTHVLATHAWRTLWATEASRSISAVYPSAHWFELWMISCYHPQLDQSFGTIWM